MGIVTDDPRLKARLRLAAMKITDFFDVVVAFEDTGKLKPHIMPFKSALAKLNVKAEECLMVGDMPHRDVAGAGALGMKTCFASYGNLKIKKSGADYTISDIKELLQIVS